MASWSASNGFVQLRSVFEIFSCCTIMRPPTKLQVFANIWPKKCYNPLSPPCTVQIYLRHTIFCSPSWKWNYKDSTWQMLLSCKNRNWWIKEGPKRGIFGSFSETVRPYKRVYICQCSLFWIKNVCFFLMCLRVKKINPNTFGPQCVCHYKLLHHSEILYLVSQ